MNGREITLSSVLNGRKNTLSGVLNGREITPEWRPEQNEVDAGTTFGDNKLSILFVLHEELFCFKDAAVDTRVIKS